MEERIQAEIERLTKQREQLVTNANQQIAAHDGAIAALQGLLKPAEASAGEVADEMQAEAPVLPEPAEFEERIEV